MTIEFYTTKRRALSEASEMNALAREQVKRSRAGGFQKQYRYWQNLKFKPMKVKVTNPAQLGHNGFRRYGKGGGVPLKGEVGYVTVTQRRGRLHRIGWIRRSGMKRVR